MKTKAKPIEGRIRELIATGKCKPADFATYGSATRFEDYVFDYHLTPDAIGILKALFRCFPVTPYCMEKIDRITKAVMALDNATDCEAQHIGEAIGYISEVNGAK
jgi:hypothetical protein